MSIGERHLDQTDSQLATGLGRDLEWSGALVSSAGQGAKFALLLSMMQTDPLSRPTLVGNAPDAALPEETLFSAYPEVPLNVMPEHILRANTGAKLFHSHTSDALLWNVMHPQPLSQFNDPARIPDEVVANCNMHTQNSLLNPENAKVDVEVDETGLYEILNELHPDRQLTDAA